MKSILFLSGEDFKEKSIQVIRKTPEAYVKHGWNVTYIVIRDNSNRGNYYYENEFNPEKVNVIRKYTPLNKITSKTQNKLLIFILNKIRRYYTIASLIYYGAKELNKKTPDILYGYEQQGVFAANLLKLIYNLKIPFISRFQGVVFVRKWENENKIYRRITNWDTYHALKCHSNLCIMTDDGTKGDILLQKLNSKHDKVLFVNNGVDLNIDNDLVNKLTSKYKKDNEFIITSISRIDDHKRVDRCINFVEEILKISSCLKIKYLIIGEGTLRKKCEKIVNSKGLNKNIIFLGAINHNEIGSYLKLSDCFISMYEGSNVGNPLIEAIKMNKIILTLKNGDTGNWIKHFYNGLIYDVDDIKDVDQATYIKMANDLLYVSSNKNIENTIQKNLEDFSINKLMSWEKRFEIEINEAEKLLQ